MDFFNKREIEGRNKWLTINLKDILLGKKCILFTTGACTYDFEMTAWTTTVTASYGEIKTVHRNFTQYPNFMIDYKKVKRLQDRAIKDGRLAYVVGFFEDYDLVWDVTNMDLEGRKYTQYCTSTTADYQKGKQEKEEIYLNFDEAIYKEEIINDNR